MTDTVTLKPCPSVQATQAVNAEHVLAKAFAQFRDSLTNVRHGYSNGDLDSETAFFTAIEAVREAAANVVQVLEGHSEQNPLGQTDGGAAAPMRESITASGVDVDPSKMSVEMAELFGLVCKLSRLRTEHDDALRSNTGHLEAIEQAVNKVAQIVDAIPELKAVFAKVHERERQMRAALAASSNPASAGDETLRRVTSTISFGNLCDLVSTQRDIRPGTFAYAALIDLIDVLSATPAQEVDETDRQEGVPISDWSWWVGSDEGVTEEGRYDLYEASEREDAIDWAECHVGPGERFHIIEARCRALEADDEFMPFVAKRNRATYIVDSEGRAALAPEGDAR